MRQLSQVVVMIEGMGSESDPQLTTFGSGIVFGVRDREAFIVVPRHVIYNMRDIRVSFKDSDETSENLTYLAEIDREELAIRHLDPNGILPIIKENVPDALSVLRVTLPAKKISALQGVFDCVADLDFVDSASGIFYVIGNPAGDKWRSAVTSLAPFEEDRPGHLLLLDRDELPGPGASGGALTTSTWELVGMYLGQSTLGPGVALNIETLISILNAYPNYPVHLTGSMPELTIERVSARVIVTPVVNSARNQIATTRTIERLLAVRGILGLRLSHRWDILGMGSYGFGLEPTDDKLDLGVGTRFRPGEWVDISLLAKAVVGYGTGADLGVSIKTPFWLRIELGGVAERRKFYRNPVYGLRLGLGVGD